MPSAVCGPPAAQLRERARAGAGAGAAAAAAGTARAAVRADHPLAAARLRGLPRRFRAAATKRGPPPPRGPGAPVRRPGCRGAPGPLSAGRLRERRGAASRRRRQEARQAAGKSRQQSCGNVAASSTAMAWVPALLLGPSARLNSGGAQERGVSCFIDALPWLGCAETSS